MYTRTRTHTHTQLGRLKPELSASGFKSLLFLFLPLLLSYHHHVYYDIHDTDIYCSH